MARTRLRTVLPADLADRPRWARAAQEQWGLCGVALAGEPGQPDRARALISPALNLPEGHPLARFALHPASAQLVQLEGEVEAAVARQVVQCLVRHLAGQVPALQAAGSALGTDLAGGWTPSCELLEAAGMVRVEEFPAEGLCRMELALDRTLRTRAVSGLRSLAGGLLPGRVAPPEPSARARRLGGADRRVEPGA